MPLFLIVVGDYEKQLYDISYEENALLQDDLNKIGLICFNLKLELVFSFHIHRKSFIIVAR